MSISTHISSRLNGHSTVERSTPSQVENVEQAAPILPHSRERRRCAVVRVRASMAETLPYCREQPYVVEWDVEHDDALSIAIGQNRREMLADQVKHWYCLIDCGGHDWGVIRVNVGEGWKPTSPTDFPPEAEIRKDAHHICRVRNQGMRAAHVADVEWWLPVYKLSEPQQIHPSSTNGEHEQTSLPRFPTDSEIIRSAVAEYMDSIPDAIPFSEAEAISNAVDEEEKQRTEALEEKYEHHQWPTVLVKAPKEGKSVFDPSHSYVVIRGLTRSTAKAVMADMNRRVMNHWRSDRPWHCICRAKNKTYVVIKVNVPGTPHRLEPSWIPESVHDCPGTIEWRTRAEIRAWNRAQLSEEKPTRQFCVELDQAECS